jgi:hypothetical protein
MATIAAIMDALAEQIDAQLSTVTDIQIDVQGRAFKAQTVPAVDMYPTGLNALDTTIAGYGELADAWPLNIRVRVSPADVYAGEDLLLALMDDEDDLSIIACLYDDRTINGLASTMYWGAWGGFIDFPEPGGEGTFLGSLLPIVIVKARS